MVLGFQASIQKAVLVRIVCWSWAVHRGLMVQKSMCIVPYSTYIYYVSTETRHYEVTVWWRGGKGTGCLVAALSMEEVHEFSLNQPDHFSKPATSQHHHTGSETSAYISMGTKHSQAKWYLEVPKTSASTKGVPEHLKVDRGLSNHPTYQRDSSSIIHSAPASLFLKSCKQNKWIIPT